MKVVFFVSAVAAILLLIALASTIRAQSTGPSEAQMPKASSMTEAIERARFDVKKEGWHLAILEGEGSSRILTTVGLWTQYSHPEIVVFAPSQGMSEHVAEMVRLIADGQALEAGTTVSGLFGTLPGAVRPVQDVWKRRFLSLNGEFYGSFDFPTVQVFWPDAQGLFPWQGDFDQQIFGRQPLLFESNLILSNLGLVETSAVVSESGDQELTKALNELFVPLEPTALDAWRWLVGSEATLFKVTIFGDVFFENPDGSIHWLDTGLGESLEIAQDRAAWRNALITYPNLFFKVDILLHFRSLGEPLKPGDVYDWIQYPMLGGENTPENFQTVSARVHVLHSGTTAQKLIEGRQSMDLPGTDEGTIFQVVINEKRQYSIWPQDRKIPDGWQPVDQIGSREECLDYIENAMTLGN